MKTRKWLAEEKWTIVLEGIKGEKAVAEICREHQIAQAQYYEWRDRFLEGAKKALVNGVTDSETALKREIEERMATVKRLIHDLRNDLSKLQKIISKQAIAIEAFKKGTGSSADDSESGATSAVGLFSTGGLRDRWGE